MNMFGAHMGMTFSGGLIDFAIYGAVPDATGAKANCY
jgi:phosphotransferase system  glucose/maltose/N-acetylglucosamine-specific IIC component